MNCPTKHKQSGRYNNNNNNNNNHDFKDTIIRDMIMKILQGQPTFLLPSKTEIHLQSTIQILSWMSCFAKYLFAIKQKVNLSGAPVLLMLL